MTAPRRSGHSLAHVDHSAAAPPSSPACCCSQLTCWRSQAACGTHRPRRLGDASRRRDARLIRRRRRPAMTASALARPRACASMPSCATALAAPASVVASATLVADRARSPSPSRSTPSPPPGPTFLRRGADLPPVVRASPTRRRAGASRHAPVERPDATGRFHRCPSPHWRTRHAATRTIVRSRSCARADRALRRTGAQQSTSPIACASAISTREVERANPRIAAANALAPPRRHACPARAARPTRSSSSGS